MVGVKDVLGFVTENVVIVRRVRLQQNRRDQIRTQLW